MRWKICVICCLWMLSVLSGSMWAVSVPEEAWEAQTEQRTDAMETAAASGEISSLCAGQTLDSPLQSTENFGNVEDITEKILENSGVVEDSNNIITENKELVEEKSEGMAAPQLESQTAPASYTVELSGTISAGQERHFTTVSPEFAGQQLPEGMYAGNLTVRLTGPVIVESGAMLSIGTLTIGGVDEASPVLQGTLQAGGLIVVRSGGHLKLTDVVLQTSGSGLLIVQEPGANVELILTQVPEHLIQWAPPVVANDQDAPQDVWLPQGQVLTEADLPQTLSTNVQYQGQENRTELQLQWDMSGYDGRTDGSVTLQGNFVQGDGTVLDSVQPLTVTVRWYAPQQIVVTDTRWTGAEACTAALFLMELPQNAEVWGEISTDGGKSWSRWDAFEILYDVNDAPIGMFYVPDNTPRYYRVAARQLQDGQPPVHWVSEAFLLPEEESEDQGGNRGGSTSLPNPDREQAQSQPVTGTDQSGAANPAEVPSEAQDKPESPEDETEQTGSGETLQTAVIPPDSQQEAAAEEKPALSWIKQIALVVLGLAVCAAVGLFVAKMYGGYRGKRQR